MLMWYSWHITNYNVLINKVNASLINPSNECLLAKQSYVFVSIEENVLYLDASSKYLRPEYRE